MAKMPVKSYYQSQRDDTHRGGTAPPEPHMVLKVGGEQWLAIPPGARMAIVADPRRIDGFFEVVFEKVKLKQGVPVELHFKVPSDKPNSTRKMIATIAWLGLYDSWMESDTRARMEQQEREQKSKAEQAKDAAEAELNKGE